MRLLVLLAVLALVLGVVLVGTPAEADLFQSPFVSPLFRSLSGEELRLPLMRERPSFIGFELNSSHHPPHAQPLAVA